ncbi:uncharacterized protein LOC124140352 isoform X1 [Haliotis rufescens]|uniref:uncharacterized protein LOC124140352 isoform X1 n=1 Tax=Haliotis rufescens TaxID=6454 RepID=UPI00201F279C|nr:uncharacterized protein LOC124140352 isoform X1 [Haliotis rufescens]
MWTDYNMALFNMFPMTSPWMLPTHADLDQVKKMAQDKPSGVIVTGSSAVGKTSLLFQCAVTHATENQTVTFICRHPLSRLPLPVHGMPTPDPSVLQAVKFVYLSDASELIGWCANIHMTSCLPDVVIIDDIDLYASDIKKHGTEHDTATVLAMVVDAAAYIRQKNGSCSLVMSTGDGVKAVHSMGTQFHLTVNHVQASKDAAMEFMLSTPVRERGKLCVTYAMDSSVIRVRHLHLETPAGTPD